MITDTTKNPKFEWIGGGNPSAIESQEAQGQKELVNSSQLPIKHNGQLSAKEYYEAMGIKVLEGHKDPLFFDVILPDGWKIVPTTHSMWSGLVDDKGKERCQIFYKAAFYDRKAFININD